MPNTHLWKPEILDLAVESDRIRLETLRESGRILEECDTLDAQVAEWACLLYTSPSPRDRLLSRMPSSA